MKPLRIGARSSLMSLAQTAPVLARLSSTPTILHPFSGAGGDRLVERAELDADGAFSKEIEAALLTGEIDVAVHCLKDLPAHDTPGLETGLYLRRDDPRDCLVTREAGLTLETLPAGTVIGTSSVRRTAALLSYRPDIEVVPMRGPVDQRLRALGPDSLSDVDALVVATCSMERLGLTHRIAQKIHPEIICPPLGAAVIALQIREGDTKTRKRIFKLHDTDTEIEVEAERLILREMEGHCNAALAGYCTTSQMNGATLYTVRARVFTPDGSTVIEVRDTSDDASESAMKVCERLTRHGARELREAV
ncbi:porphobilinogen deaminase 2 [Streptomyces inusitatus]|uniref:Hydroxymethylbilane synthase n=1 Tax=Streptomyces inusitatus TaxID=68221 RepID=A0A918Q5Z7_9ACTN|nr:hydroxymethylbilane synthase [Streptomyces inusitatus]GGZ33212.1 porphobilinogen deaminase 2 [Streptomyces inusitatus]